MQPIMLLNKNLGILHQQKVEVPTVLSDVTTKENLIDIGIFIPKTFESSLLMELTVTLAIVKAIANPLITGPYENQIKESCNFNFLNFECSDFIHIIFIKSQLP